MSLAIAVGKSSSSSCFLWRHDGSKVAVEHQGGTSCPQPLGVALAVSSDQMLRATATFRQDLNDGYIELRVRVFPAAEQISDCYPETTCRLQCPTRHENEDMHRDEPKTLDSKDDDINTPPQVISDKVMPSVLFSSDSKFLSCLIPSSTSRDGTVVVFQLTTHAPDRRKRPPLPSYIQTSPPLVDGNNLLIPVAVNEQVISSGLIHGVHRQISALEDMTMSCRQLEGGPSILLVACKDGSILGASYSPLTVAGVLYEPQADERLYNHIRQLKHCTEWNDRGGESQGKLAAIYDDGSVLIFVTHIADVCEENEEITTHADQELHEPISSSSELRVATNTRARVHHQADLAINVQPIYRILSQSFICCEWLCGSYLALMRYQESKSLVECYAIAKDGAKPIIAWNMTPQRLMESYHVQFAVDAGEEVAKSFVSSHAAMQYDPMSECLAISGVLMRNHQLLPFACVWNWHSNVEGLVICSRMDVKTSIASVLNFSRTLSGASKLVHIFSAVTTDMRLSIDLYDVALLSPKASYCSVDGSLGFRKRNTLLLSPSSVSFPHVNVASTKRDYEIEWRESALPAEYIQSQGAARLASIGTIWGRSIAVASSHGFCTLDCSNALGIRAAHSGFRRDPKRFKRRWRRFGKVAEEEVFSVLAFSWWEGHVTGKEGRTEQEDLLVAIIEVRKGEAAGRYLSCWSAKMLDLDHQLMFPVPGIRRHRWGVSLPRDFHPSSINLLCQPVIAQCRTAILLLSDSSVVTKYSIYQLQVVCEPLIRNDPYLDKLSHFVMAHCASIHEIGTPAELFLASGFFGFDFRSNEHAIRDPVFVATVAVLRFPAKGLDALAISREGVVAVGQVIAAKPNTLDAEVASICQADFVELVESGVFVWLLELTDGTYCSWFVPCSRSSTESTRLLKPMDDCNKNSRNFIHSECRILGYSASAGRASLWLHQSVAQPQKQFMLGTSPGSTGGCIFGSGQAIEKFHRSLGEHFEKECFRSDFLDHEIIGPSNLILSFPAFLPSYYSQLLDACRASREIRPGLGPIFRLLSTTIHSSVYQDVAFKSLRLLISRLAEEIETPTERNRIQRGTSFIFAALVEFIRSHLPPLQFAATFLEMGRQLEPCYFESLFPLPDPPDGLAIDDGESVLDLYDMSLDNGSVVVAASSLPLLHEADILTRNCQSILNHCLDVVDTYVDTFGNTGFDVIAEEQLVISDIFRYVNKVEDASSEHFDDFDSSEDEDVDDVYTIDRPARSSLFCGMFGRTPTDRLFTNGKATQKLTSGHFQLKTPSIDSGARMVGRFLLKYVFEEEHWKKASVLAALIAGESTSGLDPCSMPKFTELLRSARELEVLSFVPGKCHGYDELVSYLASATQTGGAQITPDKAAKVLDLVLILLGRCHELSREVSGLLLIALVAACVAGRLDEIAQGESRGRFFLLDAYNDALTFLHYGE